MARPWVFVMDPLERININTDSTFVMMLEAQRRGHPIYFAEPGALEQRGKDVWIEAHQVEVRRKLGDAFTLQPAEVFDLNDAAAVFMRKDPPFDIEYVTSCWMLDRIDRDKVVLINDPRSILLNNEKLFALNFPALIPETIVSRRPARIRRFIEERGDVVVKPLTGAGGAGVVRLVKGDKNTKSILDLLTVEGRLSVEAQVYLPDVVEGDRRVLLLDGDPIGVINRRPKSDDLRSNMHAGGVAEKAELTPRDQEICAAIGPELKRLGLVFVGIDIIGGKLTEINVTSPTGIQEINRFDGSCLEASLIDWVEARLK